MAAGGVRRGAPVAPKTRNTPFSGAVTELGAKRANSRLMVHTISSRGAVIFTSYISFCASSHWFGFLRLRVRSKAMPCGKNPRKDFVGIGQVRICAIDAVSAGVISLGRALLKLSEDTDLLALRQTTGDSRRPPRVNPLSLSGAGYQWLDSDKWEKMRDSRSLAHIGPTAQFICFLERHERHFLALRFLAKRAIQEVYKRGHEGKMPGQLRQQPRRGQELDIQHGLQIPLAMAKQIRRGMITGEA